LRHPSSSTGLAEWGDPEQLATAIPGSAMPGAIGDIDIHSWTEAPVGGADWERLAERATFDEPAFKVKPGKNPASGAVVVEPDGRVWVVSPSNQYAGYTNTFPKGTIYPHQNISMRANALKEVYEESGLQVELFGFLADSDRSLTTTRYYLARRVGGNPADMGWESQAVHLVPKSRLAKYLTHKNDQSLLEALLTPSRTVNRADILKAPTLNSGHRIRQAMDGFRARYGKWPTRVLMNGEMVDGLKLDTLTDLGWAMLVSKLEVVRIREGRVIVEGESGDRFEYGESYEPVPAGKSADVWIWGCHLA
jgi:ADP-ribose pyrophosphatase YjhB (NUDIX family)